MERSIKECLIVMRFVNRVKSQKTRKLLIKSFDECIIKAIQWIVFNIKSKDFKLPKDHVQLLLRYKAKLRKIAAPVSEVSLKQKHAILNREGSPLIRVLVEVTQGL